jgi:mannose-6-phosphate isomerase-like protein (cupin superfamily)
MTERLQGMVKKGWGSEIIWATNDNYCGKILIFEKMGAKCSMHFHRDKDETWFVNAGKFKLRWIDTETSALHEKELNEGDTWHNPPLQPHQLEAMVPNSIIDLSITSMIERYY